MKSSKKVLTLCIVHRPPRVLLGMKKRGFGVGKWNGFGGKIREGETIEEAARRELQEEAGIIAADLEPAGVCEFVLVNEPHPLEVHIFRVSDFDGEPAESEEMAPQWFAEHEIPFDRMWPDDRHWMPLFLQGKQFRGRFVFDAAELLIDHELHLLNGSNEGSMLR